MKKHLKEFFLFPDILFMCIVCAAGFTFTLIHIATPWIWLAWLSGALSFALGEYLIHRFLFHLKPPHHPFLLSLLKRLHYDHHEDPDNLKLLFLPIWYSGPLILLSGGIAYLITKNVELTLGYITGTICYHLYYEWKHFIAHRPIKPLTPWGRKLKKLHLLHHFKNENYWFGVTHLTMDRVMGTYGHEKEVPLSSTARKLSEKGKNHLH
ncbi:sterol desaturase family protein [Thermoflavimicrobium dichotomicum]|uniref:Fatty acid hydroxylase superfamily protein n=1 Tax=Thermoflavimicrobium dichotomicum TaxID=46223 RepID=A0A1I3TC45_9BACL|nr:sterol desaturase family protein [Thermoflavimicrobium dichotomicum]SFJ68535.1 Fatty acid hydroxylase superfamily protein [Thermoflavimicrobium dichotomicum]